MAVFHFSMQVISRSAGRSACAASAYRAAAQIHDERTGQLHDYTRKRGVLDSTVLAPARAPEWARQPQSLWNAAEAAERRKDAQVARENVIALPCELSPEENRAWLHAFVQEAYVKRGMAAQVDLHAPHRQGDERNVHAHVMLTMRQLTRNGFKDKKARNWNEKATLHEWRSLCADHMNRALERAGHQERVDHRSFEAQGVDRMPTRHLGPDASQMERKGRKTRIGDENRKADEYNREMEQMRQELRIIDGAIAEEEKRLSQQKSLRRSEREVRSVRSFASELDPARRKGSADQRARIKLEKDLKALYGREETEQHLEASKAQLEKSRGWFHRIFGRTAALEDQVRSLELNLENIRQRETEARRALERRLGNDPQRRREAERPLPSPAPQRALENAQTGPPPPEPSLSRDYNRSANDNAPDPDAVAQEAEKQRRIAEIERRLTQRRDRGRDRGMER